MKKLSIRLFMLFLLTIVLIETCFNVNSVICAEQSDEELQTRSFIEDVLNLDLSQYTITLANKMINSESNSEAIDWIDYTIHSSKSSLTTSFGIQKGSILSCLVYVEGEAIMNITYSSLFDAITSFLERYGAYCKIDSTELIAMLDTVDISKNISTVIGNTVLTVTNKAPRGEDLTYLTWTYRINEADYTSLQVSFQKNGALHALRDDRAIYTIGDTSINVSEGQAVELALEAVGSYSYEMPGDYWVSGFNVTEEYISATLASSPVDGVLRPYWDIRMPLNQTYPGNVQGLTVFLWANTGEVISISNMAYGGIQYPEESNTETVPSSTEATSVEPSITQDKTVTDLLVPLGIAAAIIAVIAVSTAAVKKRKQ